jgi:hypothetical protein
MNIVVSTVNVVKVTERQMINRQVEEFLARGGKIESIETTRRPADGDYFLPVANTDDTIGAEEFFE